MTGPLLFGRQSDRTNHEKHEKHEREASPRAVLRLMGWRGFAASRSCFSWSSPCDAPRAPAVRTICALSTSPPFQFHTETHPGRAAASDPGHARSGRPTRLPRPPMASTTVAIEASPYRLAFRSRWKPEARSVRLSTDQPVFSRPRLKADRPWKSTAQAELLSGLFDPCLSPGPQDAGGSNDIAPTRVLRIVSGTTT
jgi:hypothetical protein